MTFLLLYCRKYFGQISRHAVPREMDTGMILQVPIDARSDAHVVIAPNHHLVALLVEFKEIYSRLLLLDDEFLGSSLVDTFQQAIDGIGRKGDDASYENK